MTHVYPPETIKGAMVTFTGRIVTPLEPDPDSIVIEDIAHHLSNLCRFTGAPRAFYSVAQHAVLVSEIVAPPLALTALLHDSAEAYLNDLSRPVKRQPEFAAFSVAEERLMDVIAPLFGLVWPFPDAIHWADDVLLRSEQRDLMPDLLRVPGDDYLDAHIQPWEPTYAERRFLNRYHELIQEGT